MLEKLTDWMLSTRDTMVQECIFDLLESIGINAINRSYVQIYFLHEELKSKNFQLRIENGLSYEATISLYKINGINDEDLVRQWRLILINEGNKVTLEKQLTVNNLDF
jgi:hypothetical protein